MKTVNWVLLFGYRVLIVSLFLILTSSANAQFFEGNVTYAFETRNGDPNTFTDSLYNLMYKDAPAISYTYYYKGNKYKSLTSSDPKRVQIYEPSENKIYSYTEGDEVAFWSEWSKEAKIEKIGKTETILGIECSAVLMKSTNIELTLYYPNHPAVYKIDASKLNETNAWEKILMATGSVPLKFIIKNAEALHVIVLTATSITEEKLDDDVFAIPNFKQVIKRPF